MADKLVKKKPGDKQPVVMTTDSDGDSIIGQGSIGKSKLSSSNNVLMPKRPKFFMMPMLAKIF